MDMHPFTDDDWDNLPHIALILETPWDPCVFDLEQSDDPNWFEHATPFPLDSDEHHGCWVGVSETIGNYMTFIILPDDMKKIIHCSNIHSAYNPLNLNLWMDPINDEPPQIIKSFFSPSISLSHGEDSMRSWVMMQVI
jgi:hypothetical protein